LCGVGNAHLDGNFIPKDAADGLNVSQALCEVALQSAAIRFVRGDRVSESPTLGNAVPPEDVRPTSDVYRFGEKLWIALN
jgi:hypothetical protein